MKCKKELMKLKILNVMMKNKFICRQLFYVIAFPIIVNMISFLEVTFVDRNYLNDYFLYVKYIFSAIIFIDLVYSIKYFKWLQKWLIFLLMLLIALNYFYGCIILILLYFYQKIEINSR